MNKEHPDNDLGENDIINRCPQCGKANQFGELCPVCADRKRIARNQRVTQGKCICEDGFGMNLSCPIHKPTGSLDKRGWS